MPGLIGIISSSPHKDVGYNILKEMAIEITHFEDYIIYLKHFKNDKILFGLVSLNYNKYPVQSYTQTEKKIHIALDGEIINRDEIYDDYFPGKIPSQNGAQLICDILIKTGDYKFIKNLNGWFNIAIYSETDNEFILFTDRLGFRPLYYKFENNRMIFSSEVKAILSGSLDNNKLDEVSVADYFAYRGVLNERTLFSNIYRFPPATLWQYRDDKWRKTIYWNPKDEIKSVNIGLEDINEKFNELYKKNIKRYFKDNYLISLTGGWDTRTMMSMLHNTTHPDSSFTYGINKNSADNIVATKIAKLLDVKHEFISINNEFLKNFSNYAEKTIHNIDGLGDITASTVLFVHQSHRNDICITGKYGNQIALTDDPYKKYSLKKLKYFNYLNDEFKHDVVQNSVQNIKTSLEKYRYFENERNNKMLFSIYELCRHYWGDRIALENSMFLLRTPYADNDFIDFLMQIPVEFQDLRKLQAFVISTNNNMLSKIPTDEGSMIMEGLSFRLIQAFIFKFWRYSSKISNYKKFPPVFRLDRTFFANNATFKWGSWFREELKNYVNEIILDNRTLTRSYFDAKMLKKIVKEHINRTADHTDSIKKIISFELFLRQFIDD